MTDLAVHLNLDPEAPAGLVLAGGRASRLDGEDKGLLDLHGEPLVAHVTRRLAPQVRQLLISANRNAERYAAYGKVLADDGEFGPWPGPLAGVLAGLRACRAAWLITTPCDAPFIPADLAARLLHAAQSHQAPLAVATAGGRRHPVCMALAVSLADDLRDYLLSGDRKVDAWQQRVGGIDVGFDVADEFANINTPDDLAYARQFFQD